MKAAVVPALGAPLEIRDVPVPEPGPGQVLVRIETCGLCHTDIHAARGEWPVKPKDLLIPGHEGVGIVEAVGAGDAARPGRAAGRAPVAGPRAAATAATASPAGRPTAPARSTWATRWTAAMPSTPSRTPATSCPVPDGVSALDAAPLTCAGVTTYKALKVAHPQPDETVMVVGIGGLGHLGLQYARIFGARTVAVDVHDEKLQLAKDLGADHVIDARGDQQAEIAALGGVDIALVTVPVPRGHAGGPRRAQPQRPAGHRRAARRQPARAAGLRDGAQGDLGDRLPRRHPQRPGRRASTCTRAG